MTDEQVVTVFRAWLTANPHADADAMLARLRRIAAEERRPSVQPGRMRLFRGWRRERG